MTNRFDHIVGRSDIPEADWKSVDPYDTGAGARAMLRQQTLKEQERQLRYLESSNFVEIIKHENRKAWQQLPEDEVSKRVEQVQDEAAQRIKDETERTFRVYGW